MSKHSEEFPLSDLASLRRQDPRTAEVVRSLGHRLERVIESMQNAADDQELLSAAHQEYLKLDGTSEELEMLARLMHHNARSLAASILGRYLRLSTNTILRYFGRRSVTVQRAAETGSSIATSARVVRTLKQGRSVLVWGPSSQELGLICNLAAIEFTGASDRIFGVPAFLMINNPLLERRRRLQEMMGLPLDIDPLPGDLQEFLARAHSDKEGSFVLYMSRIPVIGDLKILFRRLSEVLNVPSRGECEGLGGLLPLPPNLHILVSIQAETDNGFLEWASGFVIVH